tara:strand:- start:2925 stop:3347 length:423 start_codon:yes stop_codon:yes gene_type:complete
MLPLEFSDALIQQLRGIQGEQTLVEFPDSVAAENDAVVVCSFLTTVYLTLDGRVLEVDLLEENAIPVVLVEPNDIWRALTVAARSFQSQELLDLLPRRHESGTDCPQCQALRWIQFGDQKQPSDKPGTVVCPQCHGLGWV